MSAALIQSLLPHLPRFAEEQGDFYRVPRAQLLAVLSQSVEPAVAENTLNLLETLLNRLAVLQTEDLANGAWCFVSFPAQLLATCLLTALSDDDSRLFAADFWNTRDIDPSKKDQQREVLRWLEQARVDNHARQAAPPIRYVYVAWSLIKLDGKILFYQREDTQKRHDATAGDYGLIGGRANQGDVSGLNDKAAILTALQAPHSPIILDALPQTLRRELHEEVGLQADLHYSFKLWRRLKPYQQVQGAAPNHALTEYYLDLFEIDLTLDGYLFLQQRLASDSRLTWMSLHDVQQGQTTDGKIPYIRALYDDFDGDRAALVAALTNVPDSFSAGYLSNKSKYSLTLPLLASQPIMAGVLGGEKDLQLVLTERQLALLLGLAAHGRGFPFEALVDGVVLHPFGWIAVGDGCALQAELQALAGQLTGSELVIECHRDVLFRLSIQPESLFFDESLFVFSVAAEDLNSVNSKIPVTLFRQPLATALGQVAAAEAGFNLSLELVSRFKKLVENAFASDDELAERIENAYEKGLHKAPAFRALGLRKLIRHEAKIMRFVTQFSVVSNR